MGLHQRLNVKFMGEKAVKQFSKLTGLLLDESLIDQQGIGRSTAQNTKRGSQVGGTQFKTGQPGGPQW